ncbi:MAG: hypothetical protein Q9M11_07485 [Mariprofundaceae bacterium]|nr:hypothetical protein [Mariprofundaceae bacterium]
MDVDTQTKNIAFQKRWAPTWQRFFVAFFAATIVFDLGHRLLDVQIELFWGISGYNFSWVLAMYALPVLAGIVFSLIYGWGGKLLSHLPPMFILGINYYSTMQTGAPEGASLIPLMWWGFFLILNMEFCAIGGFIGELLLRYHYGTLDMPGTADYAPADSERLPDRKKE